MKRSKIFVLAFGLTASVVLLAQGCGDDGGGGDKGLAIDRFCPKLVEVFCQKRLECFSKAALEYEGYTTQQECEDALQDLCKGQPDGWNKSIEADRLTYHPEKAQACFDAVSKSACEQLSWENTALLQECQDVFVGLVGRDGDCTAWSGECTAGYWCMPNGFPQLTCKSGTCKMFKAENEACDNKAGDVCQPGLYCFQGKCAKPKEENGDCSDGSACAPGLRCLKDNKCHKIVPIGEACDDTNGDPCDAHSYCFNGKCEGLPKEGEACGGDRPTADCWASYCVFPEGASEGKCPAFPKVGEDCSQDTTVTCINGYCDLNEGKCKALKDDDAACENNNECKSGVCHPVDKVCVEEYCP